MPSPIMKISTPRNPQERLFGSPVFWNISDIVSVFNYIYFPSHSEIEVVAVLRIVAVINGMEPDPVTSEGKIFETASGIGVTDAVVHIEPARR